MARKIINGPLIQRTINNILSKKGDSTVWKEFMENRKEEIDALYQDYLRDLAYEKLKGSEDVLNQSIEELPLDSRAKNILISQGILTVKELVQYSYMDLSHMNSLGRVTLSSIEDYIERVGLSLSKTNKKKF